MKNMNKISLITLIFALSSFPADWQMFRGNSQRNGYYPEPVGFPKGEDCTWKKSFGYPIVSSPSVVDNTLYIGTRDSCIYALDALSGEILWKEKTGGWVDSSPLIWEDMVIVGSSDGNIYILDNQTGETLSLLAAGFQFSSPAVLSDGTVITGMGPPFKQFSAYGPTNPKWDKTRAAWSVNFLQMSYSSPAVYKNMITIGAGDGRLYGISASKKDTAWYLQTGGGVDLSTPALDDKTVYFAPGNYDKCVYAVELIKGKLLWASRGDSRSSLEKTGRSNTIHPMQFIKLLRLSPEYRSTIINRLRARGIHVPSVLERSRTTGSAKNFYPYGGMKTSSVAVGEENVYVVQKELGYPKPRFTLLALDKDNGKEKWRFSELRNCIKLGYCSSPVVTSHMIFFGWGEGKFYAFETKTGKKIWEDTLSGDIISSPAIADGNLYISTINGNIYCYSLTETAPGESFRRSTYCFPNPARSGVSNIQVYVDKKATLTIVVYNVNEKPVFRVKRSLAADEKFVYKWNLSNVANGVYLAVVTVEYEDGNKDKKILKIAVLH